MGLLLPLILASVVAFVVNAALKSLGLGMLGQFLALLTWAAVFFLAQHYLKELLE